MRNILPSMLVQNLDRVKINRRSKDDTEEKGLNIWNIVPMPDLLEGSSMVKGIVRLETPLKREALTGFQKRLLLGWVNFLLVVI